MKVTASQDKVIRIIAMFILLHFAGGCSGGPWGSIETKRYINGITWSPDGENIAFITDIYLIRYGRKYTTLWGGATSQSIKFHKVYFNILNLSTGSMEVLFEESRGLEEGLAGSYSNPRWRDDKLFVEKEHELYFFDPDVRSLRKIGDNLAYGTYKLQFQPSGDYILYSRWNERNSWQVIKWDGSDDRTLTTSSSFPDAATVECLGWSTQEVKIYFKLTPTISLEAITYAGLDIDGNVISTSTIEPEYEEYKDESISPDSRKILYDNATNGYVYDIYLTDYDPMQTYPSGGTNLTGYLTGKDWGYTE